MKPMMRCTAHCHWSKLQFSRPFKPFVEGSIPSALTRSLPSLEGFFLDGPHSGDDIRSPSMLTKKAFHIWRAFWLGLPARRMGFVALAAGRAVRDGLRPTRRGLVELGRGGHVVIESFDNLARQTVFHNFFEFAHHVGVFGRDQGEGIAGSFGPACPSDTVDIGVGGVRHVEVDDV
jgi:hypothetical protein